MLEETRAALLLLLIGFALESSLEVGEVGPLTHARFPLYSHHVCAVIVSFNISAAAAAAAVGGVPWRHCGFRADCQAVALLNKAIYVRLAAFFLELNVGDSKLLMINGGGV
ncbi:hypothetical protein MA16_Dca009580 [Dendrobium catenatum]|uniref:Secreted protein n=1 Tax=Dendrobium catenatum TaxID=906689 RepID=A0A2I0VS22_9ASPA|nr:hypothetical protein MA16_Dca009580 [Dendrobium catenatum]